MDHAQNALKGDRTMLSYAEVASLLGVPVGTVYGWVHNRAIPHVRLGPRLVRFARADVDAWLEQRRVRAAG
jgi:excisionase family DNA binding protein